MQVTELKNEGLKREFQITLSAEDLSKQVDARISNLAKQIKMPGFRPGKVPLAVIRKKHGKDVLGEVLQNTVADTSQKLLKERKLSPALEPKIEVASFAEGADLVYNLSFEIYPELPEFDFGTISLEQPKVEVAEKDISEAMERLQKSRKQFKPIEKKRAAKDGDAVVIDFEGSINGVAFPGGAGTDYRLELGSGSFIKGFEEQLVGSKKGEKVEVNVTFPENYGSTDLAGKDAVFAVTVNDILASELPEVNDEFAKTLGFEDLAKLNAAISTQIEEDFANLAKIKMKKELFDKLDKEVNFEVPEGMVELEYRSLLQNDPDKVEAGSAEEKSRNEEYKSLSTRRVKLGILLADIGRKNSVSVTEDELRRAVFEQVRNFPGQEQRVIEFYQKNKDAVDHLRGPILEDKVVDLLISKAKVVEKKISTSDLMEFRD
jgi:trigger factor